MRTLAPMPSSWAAIVGWGQQGRGDVTQRVIDGLRAKGRRLGGCLQLCLGEGDEILGYDLVDLDDGTRFALARPSTDPEVCNWGFDYTVFAEIQRRVIERAYDIVVLELGPIEARGKGHWETVQRLLAADGRMVVLCIRPRVLARIALDLPDPAAGLELPATDAEIARFVEDVAAPGAQ